MEGETVTSSCTNQIMTSEKEKAKGKKHANLFLHFFYYCSRRFQMLNLGLNGNFYWVKQGKERKRKQKWLELQMKFNGTKINWQKFCVI